MPKPLFRSLLLSVSLCVAAPVILAAETLVVSDQQAASHPAVKTEDFFGRLIAERSKGVLNLEIKANGSAGTETETLKAVQEGRLAMVRVPLALLDNVPSVQLASLPYLFRSRDHLWKIFKGDFGRRMDAEMEKAGVVRLMYLDSSPRNFYCTRPLKSQADFARLRVRIPASKVFDGVIRNLGAQPVEVPFNKVTDAFKSGSLDCADGGVVNYVAAEHYKVASYMIEDEHLLMPDVLLISKKVWDRLPAPQQQILRAAGEEGSAYMTGLWREQESAALATMKKAGVTIVPKSQISMTGIEAQAIKTYNEYVKSGSDLETIMRISTTR
jgi:TRAP-type C4-dicarboxylate transport system substrate-binding protein